VFVIKPSVRSECHAQANRQSPDQVFKAFSFSLNTAEESAAALQAASNAHSGQVPDAVFACAGAAKPMYLLEMQPEDLSYGMANGYWIQAWTAFVSRLFNSTSGHGQEHGI
jgi:3-dehydrosphinganine reductase